VFIIILLHGLTYIRCVHEQFGKTALIHAANGGHTAIVDFLARISAESLRSPDKWGFTAKDWADHNGHKTVAQLLAKIEKEADERRQSGLPVRYFSCSSLPRDGLIMVS
jgi:ankyrin repeat protein